MSFDVAMRIRKSNYITGYNIVFDPYFFHVIERSLEYFPVSKLCMCKSNNLF